MARLRLTKEDWLGVALSLLETDGAGTLTIDRLTRRLGVTKGSFYHHFSSREQLSHDLLEAWEERLTGGLIEASRVGTDFADRNRRLTEHLAEVFEPRLEVAIRAWALQDPLVREVLERVDRRRVGYLRELFGLLEPFDRRAEDLALIRYAFTVGAQQLQPALAPDHYARLFEVLEGCLEDLAGNPSRDPGDPDEDHRRALPHQDDRAAQDHDP